MGKLLTEVFKTETDFIKDGFIQKLTIDILSECSEYNALGPASSSGKYHPQFSLGYGGLIRHTKAVFAFLLRMMSCNTRYDNIERQNCMLASAILHDMDKFQENIGLTHTNNNHPVLTAERIRNYKNYVHLKDNEKLNREVQANIEFIARNVECHMSRWNKVKVGNTEIEMPIPENEDQYLLCYADMIAASKFISIDFDDNWKIKIS